MRWKAKVAFDGTTFYGWATQSGGNTVQDLIEARISKIAKQKISISGASRTDSGVHAKGQFFHFDLNWNSSRVALLKAIQSGLLESIQIVDIKPVHDTFHARFDAYGKRYIYRIHEGYVDPFKTRYVHSIHTAGLDIEKMQDAAQMLVGKYDFKAFAAERRDGVYPNTNIDMRRIDVKSNGNNISIIVEAGGFVYKMVRSLSGALIEVGLGKTSPEQLKQILLNKKRTKEIVTAPARGLTLENVFYKPTRYLKERKK